MVNTIDENQIRNMLLSIDPRDVDCNLEKEVYVARCIKCYDGDSPTFLIIRNDKPEVIKTRLYGIDTPEMKGDTRERGIVSRNELISLLTDQNIKKSYDYSKLELEELFLNNKKLCRIETIGTREKYGRLLCNVFIQKSETRDVNSDISVVEYMLNNDLGVEYYGGTKCES